MASDDRRLIRMTHHGDSYLIHPVQLTQERAGHTPWPNDGGEHVRREGDEPAFVTELIRRQPHPVLLVGAALLPDRAAPASQAPTKKAPAKPVSASSMSRHPDEALAAEFNDVKAGVARFTRRFARHERPGDEPGPSWARVDIPNPNSTGLGQVRSVEYVGRPHWAPWRPTLEVREKHRRASS